ncbi:acyltransferase domain-containing protein [Actinokineospora sp. PR83]|uniref:acyltransferase domain-containing protein n=1 Tax=Actinokineospora sp. PR83 TaxID=2884908 RepID=UPI001F44C2C0|nr:acyltransferase domain-containing protein [Actinokineospora sp. PR83]MCG8914433.1 acyltransferase domain-containing protein [Actinokineospora sp. PR83]
MIVPLLLSAPTSAELVAQAESLSGDLPALGRALAARARPEHRFRTVLLAHGPDDLAAAPAAAAACAPLPEPGPVAFLFSGQSSQRVDMGARLGLEFPQVDAAVARVCARVDPMLPTPLRSVVAGAAEGLDDCAFAQPSLLGLGIGLFELLTTAGLRPDVVTGHSFGEYVAATAAGVWSLEDAAAVVTSRGLLLDALPPGGGMIAIEAPEDVVAPALAGTAASVSAVHDTSSVAIAGPLEEITAIADRFAARGVRTNRVGVGNAYHSPAVDPAMPALAAAIAAVPGRPAAIPLVGNSTGDLVPPGDAATPDHWTRHCRLPVRWSSIMDTLQARGVATYVEVGPSGVLSRLAARCLPADEQDRVVPALQAEPDETTAFLTALARLDARGHRIDWQAVFAASTSLRA